MDKEYLVLTRKSIEAEASISRSMESINRHTEKLTDITSQQNMNLQALENSMSNLNDKFGLHMKNNYELNKQQLKWIILLTALLIAAVGGTSLLKLFGII